MPQILTVGKKSLQSLSYRMEICSRLNNVGRCWHSALYNFVWITTFHSPRSTLCLIFHISWMTSLRLLIAGYVLNLQVRNSIYRHVSGLTVASGASCLSVSSLYVSVCCGSYANLFCSLHSKFSERILNFLNVWHFFFILQYFIIIMIQKGVFITIVD